MPSETPKIEFLSYTERVGSMRRPVIEYEAFAPRSKVDIQLADRSAKFNLKANGSTTGQARWNLCQEIARHCNLKLANEMLVSEALGGDKSTTLIDIDLVDHVHRRYRHGEFKIDRTNGIFRLYFRWWNSKEGWIIKYDTMAEAYQNGIILLK